MFSSHTINMKCAVVAVSFDKRDNLFNISMEDIWKAQIFFIILID